MMAGVIGAIVRVSIFNFEQRRSLMKVRLRNGHAPGHVRDCFAEAVEAFYECKGIGPEPKVDFEINYEPTSITLSEACGLLWNCTDIMPGWMVDILQEYDLKRVTYAGGARTMRRVLAKR